MEQQICSTKNNDCLNFYKIFWVFVVFSIAGTLSEGVYWVFRYGHYAFRTGMIYGPFSEVYGLAATLILLLLYRYRDKHGLFIFISAYIVSVGFEFTCSLTQQLVFGYTSWDYGDSKFALLGRANLIYAIPWALFGVLLVKVIYPWLCRLLSNFLKKPGVVITWIVIIFMIFNAVVSAAAVYRYQQRQQDLPATTAIQSQLDQHYPDAFMEKKFARLGKANNQQIMK